MPTGRDHAWFAPARDTAAPGTVANPFRGSAAASRYVAGRPYYHAAALALADDQLDGAACGPRALDLGCGTGLSARALKTRADVVVAADSSPAMVRRAPPLPGVRYLAASAEHLPLRADCIDLATVAAALHWFDQPRVFAELGRVLRRGGALIVYSDFFTGQLAEDPRLADWLINRHLASFPTPPRHRYFDPAAAAAAGFATPRYGESEITLPTSCQQVADYLLSQSNAAVAVDSGLISAAQLRERIISQTAEFFPAGVVDVIFGIRVWTTVRT